MNKHNSKAGQLTFETRAMKFILTTTLIMFMASCLQAQEMFQVFKGQDIGSPALQGSHSFDSEKQSFTLKGAGYNMWFERDEYYSLSTGVKGNFILSTNLKFSGKGVNPHRKMGLIIRNSNANNDVHMNVAIHGDGLSSLQYRKTQGKNTAEIKSSVLSPGFVQIERTGNQFIVRISKDKQTLKEIGRVELDMNESVLAGLFVCSHEEEVIEQAEFWNIRLEKPADDNVNGYQNPSPSRLEILDVETGIRKVVYETDKHIEAPNWSMDGKYLIYNSGGSLYKFDLPGGEIKKIDTGFANANNNDHGISFDGKKLAISHHTTEQGKNHSIIYTLPVEGGTPQRITAKGPSYWHGWSPDGKWLSYCAERNGNYDVYKIPSEGGDEIRLTNAEGLDDGPEYTPDGNHIYFNSTRSGKMQIWKMKPDGSEQSQVTDDEFQNWFAHISPDGKQMIFISYLPHVPANSHPHNKRVMLRLKPVNGGKTKTLAFLYGGQGTINVPSWSPDSKKVAFVSYTY